MEKAKQYKSFHGGGMESEKSASVASRHTTGGESNRRTIPGVEHQIVTPYMHSHERVHKCKRICAARKMYAYVCCAPPRKPISSPAVVGGGIEACDLSITSLEPNRMDHVICNQLPDLCWALSCITAAVQTHRSSSSPSGSASRGSPRPRKSTMKRNPMKSWFFCRAKSIA